MRIQHIGRRTIQQTFAISTAERERKRKKHNHLGCTAKKIQKGALEIFGDKVAAAIGPGPREGVVIQHPGHDIVHAGRLDKLLALEVVVVGHVEPDQEAQVKLQFLKRKKERKKRDLHVAEFVSDRKSGAESVVLNDGARRGHVAHGAQFSQAEGVAFLLLRIPANVFSAK